MEKKTRARGLAWIKHRSSKANLDEINYEETKEGFILWMKSRCSIKHTDNIISYLDRYLTMPISNPIELFSSIESVEKGKRHFCMGVRDLLKFYEAFSLMEDENLIRYRKVVKIPQTNTDNYIPEDDKVILAFSKVDDEKYRMLFKLLAFSGIRLREAIYLLNNFDAGRVITNNTIAKYPLSLERRTKRVFYAYMPKEFTNELRRIEIEEEKAKKHIAKGIPAKYIRKWNYNFLILNNIPESVADYLQGRAPSTVGSMHYLAKVKQSDFWYSKVIPMLLNFFS